jgi:hypothetical protein
VTAPTKSEPAGPAPLESGRARSPPTGGTVRARPPGGTASVRPSSPPSPATGIVRGASQAEPAALARQPAAQSEPAGPATRESGRARRPPRHSLSPPTRPGHRTGTSHWQDEPVRLSPPPAPAQSEPASPLRASQAEPAVRPGTLVVRVPRPCSTASTRVTVRPSPPPGTLAVLFGAN